MNLQSYHPQHRLAVLGWKLMRDTWLGEDYVKQAGTDYLAPTGAMERDGMQQGQPGQINYVAYVQRSVFHEFVSTAVQAMVGIMHGKDPVVELPPKLEPLINSATAHGEPLKALLRRINMEQLITGRLGLMLDLPEQAGPDALPYLATYTAESIINWDTRTGADGRRSFDFITLDERGPRRQPGSLEWKVVPQHRFLTTGEFLSANGIVPPGIDVGPNDFVQVVCRDRTELLGGKFIVPEIAGKRIERIPFVTIGALDLDPTPDKPPLMPLARKAISLYRLEADYRYQLYMQAQDTLVIIGQPRTDDAAPTVGANAILFLDQGADAKFVGVNSAGLGEMRQAVENEKREAAELGAQIIDAASAGSASSGEALAIRVAARTATLTSIARAAGDGLTRLLQAAAEWVGADPSKVVVEPNTDFSDEQIDAATLLSLTQAKNQGAPISGRTIHQIMRAGEMTEMTYEEELTEIEEELDPAGLPAVPRRISLDLLAVKSPAPAGQEGATDPKATGPAEGTDPQNQRI